MRFAYTLVMSVLVPLAFVRLWVRGLTNPAYRGAWRHRFGFVKTRAKRAAGTVGSRCLGR